ncbi:LLM class flavin-dependent oxidoreductase [Alteribacillus iranensis]|uniref:Luciferase family oxidoreductase, group 1 n=1 Tax=Alteribacillus iranensis TaxID=930128 RepID=A0A1I2BKQ2_9BACI|nr:LLM class flavin-dependent oxidoreductase [Alteribacillus iranensis]SFE55843.1 luciferase family oxidoreductase, group 1 [Alteribacillus iranensis]
MKLSILDQSPIMAGQTPQEALEASVTLAQLGERLGYTRFWMTEHHDLAGLASSAPEVMLSYIGAQTESIRLGTGAVLLPHYKPYKVAEIHHTLATLFPDRIDVGVGRAPGGSAEATNALSDNYLQQVYKMPDLVKQLLRFIDNMGPEEGANPLSAAPVPDIPPEQWLLGTSEKSARLAAENGMAYAFGQFMSDNNGPAAVQTYRESFQLRKRGQTLRQASPQKPQVIVTVSALCAETASKAEDLARCNFVWSRQKDKGEEKETIPFVDEAKKYPLTEEEEKKFEKMKRNMALGDPAQVRDQLLEFKAQYEAEEVMINTIAPTVEDRLESYRLIGGQLL